MSADELKNTIAKNIVSLRNGCELTQAELGEKLNYSDKAVSKWERAEAMPDAFVLSQLAELFQVPVDYLFADHSGEPDSAATALNWRQRNYRIITLICTIGIWAISLLAYVILDGLGKGEWIIFIYTLPVMLVALLVLNSLWEKGKHNFFIISALIWSVLAAFYFTFLSVNPWKIFLLGIPAELITYLCSKIRIGRTKQR